ncbi:group II intron maturase-specific domain-containing protein [Nocardia gipuzkoensis]
METVSGRGPCGWGGGSVVVAGGDVPAVEAARGGRRAKGASEEAVEVLECQEVWSPVNTDELRGWSGYFRAGVSSAVFSYLSHHPWKTVWRWLLRKHRKLTRTQIGRRYSKPHPWRCAPTWSTTVSYTNTS